jgi:hypothetical protein
MSSLINDLKRTIVFLGTINEKKEYQYYATGFLLDIKDEFHLVTAKHVVRDSKTGDIKDKDMIAFFNLKDGTIGHRPISDIKNAFSVDWIFHESSEVDIAIIPFGVDLEKDDVRTIPESIFLTSDKLFELYDVFFLAHQPNVLPQNKISPIIRTGVISLINTDGTFYIDAPAFPGNSRSPVFLRPSALSFDEKAFHIGGFQYGGKFVGIIGEYVPYQEVAVSIQTSRPRVVFEENTGLSRVWPVTFIKEIIESDVFKKQLERLQKESLDSMKQ